MEKDRDGLDCNVLRFVAQMDTTRPIDIDRRFIVFYFLSDDTISIYEPIQRNSGNRKEELMSNGYPLSLSLCTQVLLLASSLSETASPSSKCLTLSP